MSPKTKKPINPYQEAHAEVLESLEGMALVKGPSIRQYRDMLVQFRQEIDDWFDASIDAASQDLARKERP